MHHFSVHVCNDERCLVSFRKDTLEEAIKHALKDVMYYFTFCNYTELNYTIDRVCDECNGEGTVPKKTRGFGRKKCPSCKGKDSSVVVVSKVGLLLCEQAKEYIGHNTD